MKFYIASRTARAEDVKSMIATLENLGHHVSHDWTTSEDIQRPYSNSPELAGNIAQLDTDGAQNADILIILCDEGGTGMYIEMGVALGNGKTVYALGDYNDVTVFHFHPLVKRVNTLEEILIDIKNTY